MMSQKRQPELIVVFDLLDDMTPSLIVNYDRRQPGFRAVRVAPVKRVLVAILLSVMAHYHLVGAAWRIAAQEAGRLGSAVVAHNAFLPRVLAEFSEISSRS